MNIINKNHPCIRRLTKLNVFQTRVVFDSNARRLIYNHYKKPDIVYDRRDVKSIIKWSDKNKGKVIIASPLLHMLKYNIPLLITMPWYHEELFPVFGVGVLCYNCVLYWFNGELNYTRIINYLEEGEASDKSLKKLQQEFSEKDR